MQERKPGKLLQKYRILIVGHGYVGSAISNAFSTDDLIIVDPKYNSNKLSDLKKNKFDVIFVCVDTPQGENFRTLKSILKQINVYLPGNIVCCKSTASPRFYHSISNMYKNISIIHSPEYLSHWNNKQDFINQSFLILGGKTNDCKVIAEIFLNRLKKIKTVRITDIRTAALIKYSENAFLALKVTFANELYKMHSELKCPSSFEDFTEMLGLDPRITNSQMQVPGRDGKFGWGGHCFIKDLNELEKFSNSPLIKFIRKLNKIHRKQHVT